MKLTVITATHKRAEKLASVAKPSILVQTVKSFEWIIVNDGRDIATRNLIAKIQVSFEIKYLEIERTEFGFGLCHARNLEISQALGEIVSYLNDDYFL